MFKDEKTKSSNNFILDDFISKSTANNDTVISSNNIIEDSIKHLNKDHTIEIINTKSSINGISFSINDDLLEIDIDTSSISFEHALSTIRFSLHKFYECKYLYIKICSSESAFLSTDILYLIDSSFDSLNDQSLCSSVESILNFKEITEQNIKEITIEDDIEEIANQFIKDFVKEFHITEIIFNKWSVETINQIQ